MARGSARSFTGRQCPCSVRPTFRRRRRPRARPSSSRAFAVNRSPSSSLDHPWPPDVTRGDIGKGRLRPETDLPRKRDSPETRLTTAERCRRVPGHAAGTPRGGLAPGHRWPPALLAGLEARSAEGDAALRPRAGRALGTIPEPHSVFRCPAVRLLRAGLPRPRPQRRHPGPHRPFRGVPRGRADDRGLDARRTSRPPALPGRALAGRTDRPRLRALAPPLGPGRAHRFLSVPGPPPGDPSRPPPPLDGPHPLPGLATPTPPQPPRPPKALAGSQGGGGLRRRSPGQPPGLGPLVLGGAPCPGAGASRGRRPRPARPGHGLGRGPRGGRRGHAPVGGAGAPPPDGVPVLGRPLSRDVQRAGERAPLPEAGGAVAGAAPHRMPATCPTTSHRLPI